MDIEQVRKGIAALFDDFTGIQVSAYLLGNPTPPSLEVIPATRSRESFGEGLSGRDFTVRVLIGLSTDQGAQARLDKFLQDSGDESVGVALRSDPTLGGEADDVDVMEDSGLMVFDREAGQPSFIGAEWRVRVYGSGG